METVFTLYSLQQTMLFLEDLPDEILLEIFFFLSPRDLYHSFAFLNDRFNCILCDPSIRLGIRLTNDLSTDWKYFLNYFTEVQIACDEIDLQLFSHVRSLILGPFPRPTDDLLNQLIENPRKHFPNLRQITIYQPLATWYSPAAARFWTQLFTNELPSRLRSCTLPRRIFALPTTCFNCLSLRQLRIGGCSMRDLPVLLCSVPNLRHLSTEIWGAADPTNTVCYEHVHLLSMDIKFTQLNIVLDDIQCLFSYIPNLRWLTIEGTRKHERFSVEDWHKVLMNQLKHLKRFTFSIQLMENNENRHLDMKFIRNYHHLFSKMKLRIENDMLTLSNQ